MAHPSNSQGIKAQENAPISNIDQQKKGIENWPEKSPQLIKELTLDALEATVKAMDAVDKLSRERCRSKLSNSRVNAVGREIKELIKVLSRYC